MKTDHIPSCACDICRAAKLLGLSAAEIRAADLGGDDRAALKDLVKQAVEQEPYIIPSNPLSGLIGDEDLETARSLERLQLLSNLDSAIRETKRLNLFSRLAASLLLTKSFVGHDLLPLLKGEPGFPGWKCQKSCKRCEIEFLLSQVLEVEGETVLTSGISRS